MTDEEKFLHEQLAALHRAYQDAAAPYSKRLGEIEACKAPRPVLIPLNDGYKKVGASMYVADLSHLSDEEYERHRRD